MSLDTVRIGHLGDLQTEAFRRQEDACFGVHYELGIVSTEMAAKDVKITRGLEDEQGDRNEAGPGVSWSLERSVG